MSPSLLRYLTEGHPVSKDCVIHAVPDAAIQLIGDARGSYMAILGFFGFDRMLGSRRHVVDTLVVAFLGPDVILPDNSILISFQAQLDWDAQTLFL